MTLMNSTDKIRGQLEDGTEKSEANRFGLKEGVPAEVQSQVKLGHDNI